MGSAFGGQPGAESVFDMNSNSANTFLGAFTKMALMGNPEARKFIEDNTGTFKAGLEQEGQEGVEQQAVEAQTTEQQGINQLNNIPPQIAQMLGAPQINPQQQAQQLQLQAQEASIQREAQNRASFEKDQEFENIMKALGNVNGLMQKG